MLVLVYPTALVLSTSFFCNILSNLSILFFPNDSGILCMNLLQYVAVI